MFLFSQKTLQVSPAYSKEHGRDRVAREGECRLLLLLLLAMQRHGLGQLARIQLSASGAGSSAVVTVGRRGGEDSRHDQRPDRPGTAGAASAGGEREAAEAAGTTAAGGMAAATVRF